MKHINLCLKPVHFRYCALYLALAVGANIAVAEVTEENSIERIHTSPAGVEIHLQSSRAFPVRAIAPLLKVGPDVFGRSHRPASGDLNRLIFLLSHRSYERLRNGESVHVVYGDDPSPLAKWDFGAFQK